MGEDISLILAKVRESCGVDFIHYREGTLRRRIHRRCMARECSDLSSYLSLLESDPSECNRLFWNLTIKYTEFFRDPEVFESIKEKVLPAMLSKHYSDDPIAVWSAGCATGEEAYSLAALALLQGESTASNRGVRVFGTDVDPDAIVAANKGVYIKNYLPKQPTEEAMRYFEDKGECITASSKLKGVVSFHSHDLLSATASKDISDIWPDGFDLVTCRNVLIYLHRAAQADVVQLCVRTLRPGGFLVLGSGEILPKSVAAGLRVVDDRPRIYQVADAGSGRKR